MSQQPNIPQTATDIISTTVQFSASDGYVLSGVLYQPQTVTVKAKLLLASATGVPQTFYRRFAEYMAGFGYQVLSFDYRGVAASAPEQLQGFEMSYLDWSRYDLSAAITFLSQTQPHTTQPKTAHFNSKQYHSSSLPLFMVGHSYGGQALGLSSNHEQVRAMFCFGTGAGWAGYMPAKERFKIQIIWNVLFPPLVALYGYLPWAKFNMGADLPKGVYTEWRRWCKSPQYFFADPEYGEELKAQYAQIKTPIYAYSALDDDWALPESRHAFMQHYRQAPMQYIDITAAQFGMQKIGHMGYFRKDAEPIWAQLRQEMEQLLSPKN